MKKRVLMTCLALLVAAGCERGKQLKEPEQIEETEQPAEHSSAGEVEQVAKQDEQQVDADGGAADEAEADDVEADNVEADNVEAGEAKVSLERLSQIELKLPAIDHQAVELPDDKQRKAASALADRFTAVHGMTPPELFVENFVEEGPVSVQMVVIGADGSQQTLEHTFESAADFEACLRNTSERGTHLASASSFGECAAPQKMAKLLVDPRVALPSKVDACSGACCELGAPEPFPSGWGVARVCHSEKSTAEEIRADAVTLVHYPDFEPRASMYKTTRALALAYQADDMEAFRRLLGSNEGGITADIEVSRNNKPPFEKSVAFDSVDELMSCVGQPGESGPSEACTAPAELRKHLGPGRHAHPYVAECTESCCTLGETNARHDTLFLRGVCFDKDADSVTVDKLSFAWSW